MNREKGMKRLITQLVVGIVGLLLLSSNVSAKEKGVFWKVDDTNKTVSVLVDWCRASGSAGCDNKDAGYLEDRPRITSEHRVSMRVTNFNFVGYDYKVDTESSEVKVYTYLNDIWGDLLSGFGAGASGEDPDTNIGKYWKQIQTTQSYFVDLIQTGYQNKEAYITSNDIRAFGIDAKSVEDEIADLKKLRDAAFDEAGDSASKFQAFSLADGEFLKLREATNDFISKAKKSIAGSSQSLGKQKAGYIVSVTLTPSVKEGRGSSSATLNAISFDYPVQSSYPLLFHVGLTHANIENVEYEKVRGISGEDLFLKVKENDGLQNFSAFLSYPLGGKDVDKAEWYGTFGTDISNIGDNFYGGLSYKFNEKWLVSFGVAYGLATKAEGETMESDAMEGDNETPAEPSRTLYQIVKEDREKSWFLSVSYTVF